MALFLYFFIIFLNTRLIVCHIPKNNSDVIITYSEHAEADLKPEVIMQDTSSTPSEMTNEFTAHKQNLKIFVPEYVIDRELSTTEGPTPGDDGVVFIPNGQEPASRYADESPSRKRVRVHDLMEKRNGDVINERDIRIESGTEAQKDIFFISGKNKEDTESPKKSSVKKRVKIYSRRSGKETMELDCTNLDCNNTISSVCGGKYENGDRKYRIFRNECYYRKVNCAFSYPENRYNEMSIEKCKHLGAHVNMTPVIYNQELPVPKPEPVKLNFTRRLLISRRSMTKDIRGQSCDHICPVTCPEDYEPECAYSPTGNRRVFLNHCKLDYNSCTLGLVWYRRPLSECVGGKKADMQQNRAFIGWMQKVGIVNSKGRLVLNK